MLRVPYQGNLCLQIISRTTPLGTKKKRILPSSRNHPLPIANIQFLKCYTSCQSSNQIRSLSVPLAIAQGKVPRVFVKFSAVREVHYLASRFLQLRILSFYSIESVFMESRTTRNPSGHNLDPERIKRLQEEVKEFPEFQKPHAGHDIPPTVPGVNKDPNWRCDLVQLCFTMRYAIFCL